MRNDKINLAWNNMCDALNANRQALGSEQYTLLINLADTLAREGEEYKDKWYLTSPLEAYELNRQ